MVILGGRGVGKDFADSCDPGWHEMWIEARWDFFLYKTVVVSMVIALQCVMHRDRSETCLGLNEL